MFKKATLLWLLLLPAVLFAEQSQYSGRKISVDFQNTDIDNVFRILSEIGSFNYVLDPEVRGRNVTIRVRDVPWDQVLDLILKQHGLEKTWEVERGTDSRKMRIGS